MTETQSPLLLRDWQGQNPTGWMMSEKLDGWRVIWDGERLYTRQGEILRAPAWFTAGLPAVALDGELFAGRGEFNSIQRRIRDGFIGLGFRVFDAPTHGGTFRKRYQSLLDLALPDHASVVEHIRCIGVEHLIEFADTALDMGGEGAVIRDPKAKHESGRTWTVQRWVPQDPRLNRRSA